MTARFRFDQKVLDNGVWCATWAVQAFWAHPIWSEYLIMAYDLNTKISGPGPIKYDPAFTHEFLLSAVSPDTPVDFDRDLFSQNKLSPLTPPNVGYQITAESNEAVVLRIGKCVSDIIARTLSPDTDFRAVWDHRFKDGHSLVSSGLAGLASEQENDA